jgi:hypothetical protein
MFMNTGEGVLPIVAAKTSGRSRHHRMRRSLIMAVLLHVSATGITLALQTCHGIGVGWTVLDDRHNLMSESPPLLLGVAMEGS